MPENAVNDDFASAGPSATNQAPRFLPTVTTSVRLSGETLRARHPVLGTPANLSDTGACLIADRPVPENSDVVVSISRGRSAHEVRLLARVVWCEPRVEPIKEIAGYVTGVRFDDAADEAVCGLIDSGIFRRSS